MLHDKRALLPGIGLFLTLVAAPFWHNALRGSGAEGLARLPLPEGGRCVLPRERMRASHMRVLAGWRDAAVRDGVRTYRHPDGSERTASLSGGCLGCHGERERFCTACHRSLAVNPDCWDCHADPRERA